MDLRFCIIVTLVTCIYSFTDATFPPELNKNKAEAFTYETSTSFLRKDGSTKQQWYLRRSFVASPIWIDEKKPGNYMLHIQLDLAPAVTGQKEADPRNKPIQDRAFIIQKSTNSPHPILFFHDLETVPSRNFKRGIANALTNPTPEEKTPNKHHGPSSEASSSRIFQTYFIPNSGPLDRLTNHIQTNDNVTQKLIRTSTELLSSSVSWNDEDLYLIQTKQKLVQNTDFDSHFVKLMGHDVAKTLANFPGMVQHSHEFESTAAIVDSTGSDLITPLSKLSKRLRKYMLKTQSATSNATRAFLLLLRSVSRADKDDIKKALSDALKLKKKQISAMNFLLDVIAASQSAAGFEAVQETLVLKKTEHVELFKRYIMALSFAVQPNKEIVTKMLGLLQSGNLDKKLEETVALATAALGFSLAKLDALHTKDVNSNIVKFITSRLHGCVEPDRPLCCARWLRALGNLASPEGLPAILEFVELGGRSGYSAIQSLRRYSWSLLPKATVDRVTQTIWGVYKSNDKIYDSSSKIAAADRLINCAVDDVDELVQVIRGLVAVKNTEVRTYVISRLQNHPQLTASLLRSAINLAVEQDKHVSYATLGAAGQSVAYEGHLAQTSNLSAMYNLAMECASGSMKTSAVSVSLKGHESSAPVISFGLYSHGLSSFMGSTESGDQENEPATAGLNLDVFDVSLPNVVFFNGISELMSLAWSASGDAPVAEMQFNLLIQNGTALHILPNGLTLRTFILNSVSIDLSGFIEISIWNRNSKSLVRNRGASAIQVTADIDLTDVEGKKPSFKRTELAEGKMDFVTNADFSQFPVKLCMQMTNSPIRHRQHTKLTSKNINETTATFGSQKTVPAKSFSFGRKNTKHCLELM